MHFFSEFDNRSGMAALSISCKNVADFNSHLIFAVNHCTALVCVLLMTKWATFLGSVCSFNICNYKLVYYF